MSRTFNIAADCKPGLHYMVDLHSRLEQIKGYVDRGEYLFHLVGIGILCLKRFQTERGKRQTRAHNHHKYYNIYDGINITLLIHRSIRL